MRKKMDSSEYGGAIFLGLNHISVKAHGGSDAKAIKNAIKADYEICRSWLRRKGKRRD